MKFAFGTKVRDVVTGFTGVITARVEYLTGCNQCAVQPPVNDKGEIPDGRYIDEDRLVAVEGAEVVKLDTKTANGFDAPPPQR